LLKGDGNTSFFHAFASKRKKKYFVRTLKDENGDMVEGEQLKNFIANKYLNLFMSHAGSHNDEMLYCVDPRVTREMNMVLLESFTGN
jgi:hypothetical protein